MNFRLFQRTLLSLAISLHMTVMAVPVPRPAAARKYTIEQFMKTIRFGEAEISPNKRTVLFRSNQDGVFNLYEIPFDGGFCEERE